MSKTNPLFESAAINIPKVSGHDMSHEHLTSMEFGALHPTLCMEVIPDSTVSIGNLTNVSLPPFAAKFNGKIDLKTELFFVPYRLVWGGWKNFASQKHQSDVGGDVPQHVPTITMNTLNWRDQDMVDMTLLEQLGYGVRSAGAENYSKSALNILCYHKIWESWYRDARLQHGAYNKTNRTGIWPLFCTLPYTDYPFTDADPTAPGNLMYDGWPLFKYRRRNYGKDYFTTALPTAVQAGVNKFVKTDGNQFSIEALRAANAFQKYAEKLAIVGDRYEDIIAATFGVRPADAIMDKPILLGSSTKTLYTVGSKNTTEPMGQSVAKNSNPYNKFYGGESGKIDATDGGSLAAKFTTSEYGVVMAIQSIVPHAYYEGINIKDNDHIEFSNFGNPAFASLGNVEIKIDELLPNNIDTLYHNDTFGYADRYAEYKFRNDRVTGTLRTGRSLSAFALKRKLPNVMPEDLRIDSQFLTITNDCMDDVLTWHPDRSEVCYVHDSDDKTIMELPRWEDQQTGEFECDCYWSVRVVNPLPTFTIPSIEPPKGDTRFVPKAGTRL